MATLATIQLIDRIDMKKPFFDAGDISDAYDQINGIEPPTPKPDRKRHATSCTYEVATADKRPNVALIDNVIIKPRRRPI